MSRHASPAAQLLRNSRLFSLPQALPRPIVEQAAFDGQYRTSDTATTPYPLRQAITTPKSSASRGDWGLKRPLPKRSANKSSEPVHSVIANDTYESVTEYNSASPHVKTLQRFQELNVAMTRQDRKDTLRESQLSALEPLYDVTDRQSGKGIRWKYENAHVRTMTPGEFETFLQSKVADRRDEFVMQLQARAHRQLLSDQFEREKKAIETGDTYKEEETAAFDPGAYAARKAYTEWVMSMSDTALTAYLQHLPHYLLQHPQSSSESEIILSRTMDLKQQQLEDQISPPDVSSNLAPVTYTTALRYALRERWWTRELEDDRSHHGSLLREKLFDSLTPSADSTTIARPAVGSTSATEWLKLLGVAEKHERDFLRAWVTREWDADGTNFATYMLRLRKDVTLESPLNNLIRDFLDMPPLKTQPIVITNADKKLEDAMKMLPPTESKFNLTTHPTAGLSYLRTNSILENHPILGPQKVAAPVRARFVTNPTDGKFSYGVAGFVGVEERGQVHVDVTTPGGAKSEKRLDNVYVDGSGRINVKLLQNLSNEALGVREGRLERTMSDVQRAREQEGPWGLHDAMERVRAKAKAKERRVKPLDNNTVDTLKGLQSAIEEQSKFAPLRKDRPS